MYAIDTAEAIRKLTAADMPEEQARVIVDTFKHPNAEVATKADIKELRQEVKADIGKLRTEFRTEMRWMKWVIATNLGFTLLIVLKLLFF